MTNRPNLDQRRAAHAWKAVEQAARLTDRTAYAREAKQLPVRIKMAGLGQALAFLACSKKGTAGNHLLFDLGEWMLVERSLAGHDPGDIDATALTKAMMHGNSSLFRRLTEEALLYLSWLTRFAESEIGTDGESER